MKIETFETAVFNSSTDSAVIEGEILNLIEELGLEGQREFTRASDAGDAVSIKPYREMTAREIKVYGLCFPNVTPLQKYNGELIPLRVLQVAAHAKQWLPVIKVWAPEPGKVDPLLVGYESEGWGAKPHILARWGEALDSFETLASKAKKYALSKLQKSLNSAKAEFQRAESLLKDNSNIDIMDLPTNVSCYLSGE